MPKPTRQGREAIATYRQVLRRVRALTGRGVTYGGALQDLGKAVLGPAFAGVFASDEIPRLSPSTPYAIANLDRHDGPGSHWVGLCHVERPAPHTMVYDSFGRPPAEIIPTASSAGGPVVGTEPDAEQKASEADCGARSLAWVLYCSRAGPDMAALI